MYNGLVPRSQAAVFRCTIVKGEVSAYRRNRVKPSQLIEGGGLHIAAVISAHRPRFYLKAGRLFARPLHYTYECTPSPPINWIATDTLHRPVGAANERTREPENQRHPRLPAPGPRGRRISAPSCRVSQPSVRSSISAPVYPLPFRPLPFPFCHPRCFTPATI